MQTLHKVPLYFLDLILFLVEHLIVFVPQSDSLNTLPFLIVDDGIGKALLFAKRDCSVSKLLLLMHARPLLFPQTFVSMFQSKQPQPLVFVRTLLQTFMFSDMQILGKMSIRQLIDDDLSIITLPASPYLDRANDEVEARRLLPLLEAQSTVLLDFLQMVTPANRALVQALHQYVPQDRPVDLGTGAAHACPLRGWPHHELRVHLRVREAHVLPIVAGVFEKLFPQACRFHGLETRLLV